MVHNLVHEPTVLTASAYCRKRQWKSCTKCTFFSLVHEVNVPNEKKYIGTQCTKLCTKLCTIFPIRNEILKNTGTRHGTMYQNV